MLLSMRCILQCYNLQYHNDIIIFLDTGNCTYQFFMGDVKIRQYKKSFLLHNQDKENILS